MKKCIAASRSTRKIKLTAFAIFCSCLLQFPDAHTREVSLAEMAADRQAGIEAGDRFRGLRQVIVAHADAFSYGENVGIPGLTYQDIDAIFDRSLREAGLPVVGAIGDDRSQTLFVTLSIGLVLATTCDVAICSVNLFAFREIGVDGATWSAGVIDFPQMAIANSAELRELIKTAILRDVEAVAAGWRAGHTDLPSTPGQH